jgi:hypothetical protein
MVVIDWNPGHRYQCQQCRGLNTYDLCDMCISRAQILHPNHNFQLVSQGRYRPSPWNSSWGPYGATPGSSDNQMYRLMQLKASQP